MGNKDVFISYKTEEIKEASWLRDTLEKNGISCWMAPESIPGGSSYAVEIPRAIQTCKVFVLILSKQAQSSLWIAKELDRAINANKIVMPFMIENCQLDDAFNFYLTNVQRYEAYENKASAMEKMIAEIRAIINIVSDDSPLSNDSAKNATTEKEINLSPDKNQNPPHSDPPPKDTFGSYTKLRKLIKRILIYGSLFAILLALLNEEKIINFFSSSDEPLIKLILTLPLYLTPFKSAAYLTLDGFAIPLITCTICSLLFLLFLAIPYFPILVDDIKSKTVAVVLTIFYFYAIWYGSFGTCFWIYTYSTILSIVLSIIATLIVGAIVSLIFFFFLILYNE